MPVLQGRRREKVKAFHRFPCGHFFHRWCVHPLWRSCRTHTPSGAVAESPHRIRPHSLICRRTKKTFTGVTMDLTASKIVIGISPFNISDKFFGQLNIRRKSLRSKKSGTIAKNQKTSRFSCRNASTEGRWVEVKVIFVVRGEWRANFYSALLKIIKIWV